MKTTFNYQIISTQLWNNNKEQNLSQHKTIDAAEKQLLIYQKNKMLKGNTFRIEEIK